MADDIDDPDPLTAMARRIHDDRQRRSDEHAALRASDAYQGAIRQFDRYIFDYGLGINGANEQAKAGRRVRQDRLVVLRPGRQGTGGPLP
jgi:hypothetical protein